MESIQTELNIYGVQFPKQEIELNKLEKKVFSLIPVGKENAKTGAYIADLLSIKTRYLADLVKGLRLKHCDVGSTTYEGYYLFKNPHEYLEFVSKYSKEYFRRGQVGEAMRFTPIAKQIASNETNFHGLIFPNQENKLTKLEKLVFQLIPIGKEIALSCSYIANVLGIGIRRVKELVRRLRLKHCDIGSTTNGGYYIFKDTKEYLEFMTKFAEEQNRRKQVIEAMRLTPMAQKIIIETNQTA